MHLSSSTPRKKARIEIIPLIDIMFFLLASFMLVSMSMIKLQAIPNNLPGKNTTAAPPKDLHPDFATIGIDKSNNFYFIEEDPTSHAKNAIPIKPSDIPARLQPLYTQQKDKGEDLKVFINVDKDAKYDALIGALDQLRAMGLSKVSFAVKKDHSFDPASASRGQVPISTVPSGAPPVNP